MGAMQAGKCLIKNERGFTLVEVLVTVFIMGILFSIATVSWQRIVESRDIDSAANQFAADLRKAHSSATNRLGTAYIIFNRRDRTTAGGARVACGVGATPPLADYCLVEPRSTGGPQFTPRNLPDRARISSPNILDDPTGVGVALPPGIVAGTTSTIEFGTDGSAAARNPVTNPTIRISTADDDPGHNMVVNTQTSRVRIN